MVAGFIFLDFFPGNPAVFIRQRRLLAGIPIFG